MATNIIRDHGGSQQMSLVASNPAAPVSGDPVRMGPLTGVALTDEGDGGNPATNTTVMIGMFVADVVVDDNGGSGIAVYDQIFYHDTGTGTPTTNLNNTPTAADAFFGLALETVAANGTSRIKVLHLPTVIIDTGA